MRDFDSNRTILIFGVIAFSIMFLSFNYNLFHAVTPGKFADFQSDSEALVIGRMIKSREDGIFSSQGRMGRYYGLPGDFNRNQENMYFNEKVDGEYEEYNSQIGLQGMVFSYLDKILSKLGLAPKTRYSLFHALNSLLLAGALTTFLLLLFSDIGLKVCAFLLLTIIFSRWQVYFGKNFYWMISFAYFPMLAVYVACKLEETGKKINFIFISAIVLLFIAIKSSMGYEYISTILLSTLAPLIYFAVKHDWSRRMLITRVSLLGIFAMVGFFAAIALHLYQLTIATGDTGKGVDLILERVLARTQTNPEEYSGTVYYESQTTSVFAVLFDYLIKGGSYRLKIPYLFWIILFLWITYRVRTRIKLSNIAIQDQNIFNALIVTTWFSILAPLSWFVLAKSHSQIHTNINYIVWHIPFMLYGCALVGKYWNMKSFFNKEKLPE